MTSFDQNCNDSGPYLHVQASWEGACTICTLVHKYINALWTVVIAGFAVLAYFAVSASIRAFTDPAPTDPVRPHHTPQSLDAFR